MPPNPSPLVSPGAESPEKLYMGRPPAVTCIPPSGRCTLARATVTPAPPVGVDVPAVNSSGGQVWTQLAVQAILPPVSRSKTYRVRPEESARIAPSLALFAIETVG